MECLQMGSMVGLYLFEDSEEASALRVVDRGVKPQGGGSREVG